MLANYICPNGNVCPIEQCLAECIINKEMKTGRCLSYRMLKEMASQRAWQEIPTVTQLLSGTREEFLKLTRDYSASPQSLVAAYFGSRIHEKLQHGTEDERMICEQRLLDPTGTYSGQFDCYDKQNMILYDTKTYGSFKAASVLGIKKIKEPVIDPFTGEVELTPRGKIKQRTRFVETVRHMRDVTLQLNAYRIMLENQGYPVKQMFVELIVRDAGTWIAKDRGIEQNAMLVKVNKVSDNHVQKFFLAKARRLLDSLHSNKMPPPCRPIETWGGLKCKAFCNVRGFCERGRSK